MGVSRSKVGGHQGGPSIKCGAVAGKVMKVAANDAGMSIFVGRKCEFCGCQATTARFGRFVCGDDECTERARTLRVCGGKGRERAD